MSTALRALVKSYRRALVGQGPDGWAFSLHPDAEPLRPAITAQPGRHPLAQTRDLLDEVLGVYAAAGRDRDSKVAVARAVWGLDAHPVSVRHACESQRIGDKTRGAERWSDSVITARAVLDSLRPRIHGALTAPFSYTLLDPEGTFPATMLAHAIDIVADPRAVDIVGYRRALELDVTASVYDVAAELMERWYGAAETKHLLYFRLHAYHAWVGRFRLAPGLAPAHGALKPTGDEYPAAARAAWTICLDRALTVEMEVVRERHVRRQRLKALPAFDASPGPLARGMVLIPPSVQQQSVLTPDVEALEQLALFTRRRIGQAGFGPSVKIYVAMRRTLLDSVRFPEERARIALADHSVHWDTVVSEDPELELFVRRELSERSSGAKPGLATHRHRARAILANKRNDWTSAHAFALQGLRELYGYVSTGVLTDPAEFLAAAEQLWLALAGISVRQIEWHLTQGRASSQFLAQHCGTALNASRRALEALEELDGARALDSDKGRGLPERRGESGRIDNRTWWVRALITRLRVGLAVHTAVKSRHILERDLCASTSLGLTEQDRRMTDVGYLSELYRALCSLDTLTPAHRQELVSLSLWLALIKGGELPPVSPISSAVADGLSLILSTQGQFTPFVAALRESGSDALLLSWLPSGGATFKYLETTGGYKAFRDEHDPHRPTTPSHD